MFPAYRVLGLLDLVVAEIFVVYIHAVTVGIAVRPFIPPATEGVGLLARRVLTKHFGAQLDHAVHGEGRDSTVAEFVGVEVLAERVGETQTQRRVEPAIAGAVGRRRRIAGVEAVQRCCAWVGRFPEQRVVHVLTLAVKQLVVLPYFLLRGEICPLAQLVFSSFKLRMLCSGSQDC